jgi:GNAT superfamily N-acetyltransferase
MSIFCKKKPYFIFDILCHFKKYFMISPLLLLILFILLLLILAFIIANTFQYKLKRYINGGTKYRRYSNGGTKYRRYGDGNPKRYSNGGTKDVNSIQKYSYSIYNGDIGLVYDELKQLLKQYNFHEEPLTKHVHLSIGSASGVDIYGKRNFEVRIINGKKQYLDPLFVNQKSVIKSILGGIKSLHYKNKLYETIKNLIPGGMKYIPKTYTIDEFNNKMLSPSNNNGKTKQPLHGGTNQPLHGGTKQPLHGDTKQPLHGDTKQPLYGDTKQPLYGGTKQPLKKQPLRSESDAYASGIYILKKINTEQQRGVRVFSTQSEYIQIKKELQINPHNAIIMDYITNPALTVDGKKFHLRMYVLLIIESGIKRCYIHDECWILTAEEKYKKGDWLNKKIHISGAKSTMSNYSFPNDISIKIDDAKFNEFKKTLAFATTFNNSIVYEENDIGYHIYGVDVLMTEDNNFLILEFNGSNMLGHDCVQGIKGTPECDIFKKRFSRDYFSFILHCTALSVFGIKRRAIPYAEVCGYGILSPFMNILTGDNRCILVPYSDATPKEIEDAKKIYFHNKSITLTELLKICNTDNIFLFLLGQRKRNIQLVGKTKQPLKKQPLYGGTKQPLRSESDAYASGSSESDAYASGSSESDAYASGSSESDAYASGSSESDAYASGSSESDAYASGIGYLTLDKNNYLTIVVIEEYQNRGIATAMIAQFLEIYAHRHGSKLKIHMINKSIFIEKIAKKLQFALEKGITTGEKISSYYTRPCRIEDAKINKVNHYQLLTYNFIEEQNGFNHDILIQHLNKSMVATKSQFVHLAYTEISSLKTGLKNDFSTDFYITKASTGSKYNKNFIIQGSELKSSLDIKYRDIDIYKGYLTASKDYTHYRNYGIDIPYLYNGYRIDINLFFFLYVSKNGVKKCYYMDKSIVVKSSILFDDELKSDHILSSANLNNMHGNPLKILFKTSDVEYKWPDTFLNDPHYKDMKYSLDAYIEKIAEGIIQSDSVPYSESNSGFSIITPTIDFIRNKNFNKYEPQIRYIYTHIGINAFNKQYQDEFSRHYYDFLTANIINSHFGLHGKNISDNTTQFVQPLKCIVNTELHVDANIISKLHLTFNKTRNKIEINLYHGYSKIDRIGHIDLNIDNIDVIVLSHIELDNKYRKKNIAVNVLFVLMEILASYYAPLNISLRMTFVKPMFQIAHTLQFHKALFEKRRQKEDEIRHSIPENKKEYEIRHSIPENKKEYEIRHSIPENKKEEDEYFIRLCRI